MEKRLNRILLDLKIGHNEVFDELYGLTNKFIYFTAFRILKNKELSEDIMHDTYIALIKGIESYSDMSNPVGYITTIVKHLSLNLIKKENRKISVDFQDEAVSGQFKMNEKFDSPLIDLAMKVLSEEEYDLVMLNVICGYKQIELSYIKGVPVSTINFKIKKALKTLKEKWEVLK